MADPILAQSGAAPANIDPVQQAAQILYGGQPTIDWEREPASEIERAMRRKWVERLIRNNGIYLAAARLYLMLFEQPRLPSDLARALAVLEDAEEELERRQQESQMREIQREVLFGERAEAQPTLAQLVQKIADTLEPIDPETIIARIFGNATDETEYHNAA